MFRLPQPSGAEPRTPLDEKQRLRHDRFVAMVVLALFVLLMSAMFWLSSLGGTAPDLNHDFWLMP